jgi:hypothetical protein
MVKNDNSAELSFRETMLQTIAERIFEDAHRIILRHAPFATRERIAQNSIGRLVIDEIIDSIKHNLEKVI